MTDDQRALLKHYAEQSTIQTRVRRYSHDMTRMAVIFFIAGVCQGMGIDSDVDGEEVKGIVDAAFARYGGDNDRRR